MANAAEMAADAVMAAGAVALAVAAVGGLESSRRPTTTSLL
jgi:hypothetical protein